MAKDKLSVKKSVEKEAKYTDIIHEIRDGEVFDVFMNNGKEVKAVLSPDQEEYRGVASLGKPKKGK